LQDAYSEELDLNASDTSSQRSVEGREEEGRIFEERSTKERIDTTQDGRTERRSARGGSNYDDEERESAREMECEIGSQDKGHLVLGEETIIELEDSQQKSPIDAIDSMPTSQVPISHWEPSATSEDAAKFSQLVIQKYR
jgi:hypothetical protein